MPGNDKPRGAVRRGGKGRPPIGTGGHGRRALRGRGPTPKAEDRPYHPAHRRKLEREGRARQDDRHAAARPSGARIDLPAGHELVAGRNPVEEAVRAGVPVSRVFVQASLSDRRIDGVVRAATAAGAPAIEVARAELDRVSEGAVHQGIAVEVPAFPYVQVSDLLAQRGQAGAAPVASLIVALDHVTDPRNVGAVLRSARAFGASGVILPTRRAAGVTVAAWKASAGAAASLPVARATNLVRALQECQRAGCFVVGLEGRGDVEVRGLGLATGPLVLVVGSEGQGLARLVRETCDQTARIPIQGVESLNVSVAAAVALYEVASLRRAAAEPPSVP